MILFSSTLWLVSIAAVTTIIYTTVRIFEIIRKRK